jgi:hypothetical protein
MMWIPSYQRPINGEAFQHWITIMQGVVYLDAQFDVSPNLARPFPNSLYTSSGVPITPYGRPLAFPMWLGALLLISLGFVPWFHWPQRFSLRTLLIFVTVVSLFLGLIICLSKN